MSYINLGYNDFLTRESSDVLVPQMAQIMTPEKVEASFGAGSIGGSVVSQNAIRTDHIVVGGKSWSSSVTWTTSGTTLNWNAHTLYLADNQQVSISAGSTSVSNSSLRYYIYWTKNTTSYLVTTDLTQAISDEKIWVCTAQVDSNNRVTVFPKETFGTKISGSNIVTGRISSTDLRTYFDLNAGVIILNDGTNDIVGIGNF